MFEIQKFTQELLDATRDEWCKQAKQVEGDVLLTHYVRMMDWVQKVLDGECDNYIYAYALVRESSPDIACAILDISHALPNSDKPWLKVLNICIEPELDAAVSLGENMIVMGGIVAASIVESLGLTFEDHPSTQLKVHAVNPLTVEFLEGVTSVNIDDKMGLKVTTHGGWLVIDKL